MNSSDYFAGDKKSPTRRELQGPRPAPLKVSKDSHKIKKPPAAPLPPRPPQPVAASAADTEAFDHRQPVIIYAVSPKVIHTTVNDFMNLVQRLTGHSSSSSATADASAGALSPAARLASIEKTSPSERAKEREKAAEFMGFVEGVDLGVVPGILSPAPENLQPISSALFSPASDPYGFSLLNDMMSPFMNGFNNNGNNNNMFVQSPSALFSAPIISPSPSSLDYFNPFFGF